MLALITAKKQQLLTSKNKKKKTVNKEKNITLLTLNKLLNRETPC